MELFITILVLLALIGVSNVINREIPFVPVPLIQIALGVIVTIIPLSIHMHLEPELFFFYLSLLCSITMANTPPR